MSDWWDNAVEAAAAGLYDSAWDDSTPDVDREFDTLDEGDVEWYGQQASATLQRALPIVLAEAARRIEAERDKVTREVARVHGGYSVGHWDGLDKAAAIVAGLAGEADNHE